PGDLEQGGGQTPGSVLAWLAVVEAPGCFVVSHRGDSVRASRVYPTAGVRGCRAASGGAPSRARADRVQLVPGPRQLSTRGRFHMLLDGPRRATSGSGGT